MENAILEDGYTEINDDLALAGRDDAAWGNCNVIVSSGFAGWGYPIRTGKHSEYVVVTIQA